MAPTEPAATKPPLRWASRVGWLVIVGSILLALAAATGAMSEREMIAKSVYVVVPLGFGFGLVLGARWLGRAKHGPEAHLATVLCGLLGAGLAAYARVFFFENIFYEL